MSKKEQQHTLGLLRVERHEDEGIDYGFFLNPDNGTTIAGVFDDDEMAEANAERLVACWNGCLDGNPDAVPELVAALRKAVDGVEIGCEPGWLIGAHAALAKWES